MATRRQRQAARKNIGSAISAAKRKRTIANLPKSTRAALGKQAAAVAQRKRSGGDAPKTKTEPYEIARRQQVLGRSNMGRAELARAVGER